jgi:hypothetical protein
MVFFQQESNVEWAMVPIILIRMRRMRTEIPSIRHEEGDFQIKGFRP